MTTALSARRPGAGAVPGRRGLAYLAVRTPPAAFIPSRSVVVQNRANAAALGEQRVAAVAEQVEVEVLVGLLLAVAVDRDGDGLRRLPSGQRAGLDVS